MGTQESQRVINEGSSSKEIINPGVPSHIAFIIDGNRRWARKEIENPSVEERHQVVEEGHRAGARQIGEMVAAATEIPGIEVITFWLASPSNLNKREPEELLNLFKVIDEELLEKLGPKFVEQNIKVDVIGRKKIDREDQSITESFYKLSDKFTTLVEESKQNTGLRVVFALNYGGDEEQEDAHIAAEKAGLQTSDWQGIKRLSYTSQINVPNPDLVIRTGGDIRPSDFMPIQTAHSQWQFLQKPWPEFGKQDLLDAVADYSKRRITKGA